MKCPKGREILLGGKEEVGERPRGQRRAARSDRASLLPLDLCEDRARRDEAACGATFEGRFSQRETADHLGLHGLAISGIVRARELEKRQGGKAGTKRREGPAVDRDANIKDLPAVFTSRIPCACTTPPPAGWFAPRLLRSGAKLQDVTACFI